MKIKLPSVSGKNLKIIGAGVLAVLLLTGAAVARVMFRETPEERAANLEATVRMCLRQGNVMIRVMKLDEAEGYFRLAIDNAPTPELRAEGGLGMGRSLLARAEVKPFPYALMAQQYLEASLDLMKTPDGRLQVYRSLIDTARLKGDKKGVSDYTAAALGLTQSSIEKAQLYLSQIDFYLQYGTWADTHRILEEAKGLEAGRTWANEFMLRRASINEKALRNQDWFAEYVAQFPDRDPKEVRAELVEQTLADYKQLFDTGGAVIKDESLFRIARLNCQEGRYAEAKVLLQTFLESEPTTHLAETLLLLSRLAQVEGLNAEAKRLITTFIKRYPVDTQGAAEVTEIVDELVRQGYSADALAIAQEYIRHPAKRAAVPDFLFKAATLANTLGRYDEAADYFTRFIAAQSDSIQVGHALIAQADICIRKEDYQGAEKWLVDYLARFPYGAMRADALFKLFDVKVRRKAPMTEILMVGAAAAEKNPQDPRTVDTMMVMARLLEKIGLSGLAEAQYNKIAILDYLTSAQESSNNIMQAVGQATLGKARCLLEMKEFVKADHLCREICRSFEPGPVRSEAAYLWATIAHTLGQREEAARRLSIVDLAMATPELAVKVEIEKNLLEIASGKPPPSTLDELLPKLSILSADEVVEYARRVYSGFFDYLAQQNDLNGMQRMIDNAANGPYVEKLPLKSMSLKLANGVLAERGLSAFVDCIVRNAGLINATEGPAAGASPSLLDSARRLEELRPKLERFM